jgi:hypothetical protein
LCCVCGTVKHWLIYPVKFSHSLCQTQQYFKAIFIPAQCQWFW